MSETWCVRVDFVFGYSDERTVIEQLDSRNCLLRFANHLHADCSERRFSVQNAKKAFVNTNPRGLLGRRAAVENRRLLSVNLTDSTSRQP